MMVMAEDVNRLSREMEPADGDALWLCRDAGLGRKRVLSLYAGGLEKAQQLFEMNEQEIRDLCIRGAGPEGERKGLKTAEQLLGALQDSSGAERRTQAELLYRKDIRFVSYEDPAYPKRLMSIPDLPACLYCRGYLPSDDRPSAAVIGARVASRYGLEQARRFAGSLALEGVQIVSGMARGVDGAAGLEALEAGGATFALLGCGPDICYPKENRRLYEALCSGVRGGGVISEYPPGMEPMPGLFPSRNRLISGLSDILLVVEAREKSGTLITVEMALEQGKEVYAVPGRIGDGLSRGCNRLLQQGAHIALSPNDLLAYFWGTAGCTCSGGDTVGGSGSRIPAGLADGSPELALWKCLDREDLKELDVLRAELSGRLRRAVSIRETGALMARLLIRGLAEEPSTGYYCRAIEKTFRKL